MTFTFRTPRVCLPLHITPFLHILEDQLLDVHPVPIQTFGSFLACLLCETHVFATLLTCLTLALNHKRLPLPLSFRFTLSLCGHSLFPIACINCQVPRAYPVYP